MKLPKIPIDYSKAGSGEAPFDVKVYLFHFKNKDIITCCWDNSEGIFSNLLNDDEIYNFLDDAPKKGDWPTDYTPMPEFE